MYHIIYGVYSKGDLDNAVKCLELYVGVAEGGGAKEPLAKACSAAGIMFNTLVREKEREGEKREREES